ncbi:MAG: 23S rRNA pseudouridine(2604) synthase RluF [Fluviicola sp.]
MDNTIRLNKFISESGMCSRREADQFIEKGMVRINGSIAKIGSVVRPRDKVMVNGLMIEVKQKENATYLMFNKPAGITTTTDSSDPSNIIDYIRYGERIFPIGRLDKDSTGLILLTSNGDIVNQILRAGNNHEKEYLVTVDKPYKPDFIEKMALGVPILGQVTKKCKVEQVNQTTFKITLIQGLNRQIRRMCEYFGYEVLELNRIRIMHLELKGLAVGETRDLDPTELDLLFKQLEGSRKDSEKANRNDQKAKEQAEQELIKKYSKVSESRRKESLIDKSAADLEYAALVREAKQKERNRSASKAKAGMKTTVANAQRSAKGAGKKIGGKPNSFSAGKKSGGKKK